MTPRFLLSALGALSLVAVPAAALAAPSQTPATAAPATARAGLPISTVRDWLVGLGASIGEVERQDGQTYLKVTDGNLTWVLFFYACEADVCGDVQYTAAFSNATITSDLVNQWNLGNRFLKAYYTPAAAGGTAIVQFDVLLVDGVGIDQLINPTSVWVNLLPAFGTHVGFFVPEAAPAPAQ